MRGCLLTLGCVGLLAGYLLLGGGITATLTHLLHEAGINRSGGIILPGTKDDLARTLQRCGRMAAEAQDDPRCQAAWAESRRRFFDYGPGYVPAGSRPGSALGAVTTGANP